MGAGRAWEMKIQTYLIWKYVLVVQIPLTGAQIPGMRVSSNTVQLTQISASVCAVSVVDRLTIVVLQASVTTGQRRCNQDSGNDMAFHRNIWS